MIANPNDAKLKSIAADFAAALHLSKEVLVLLEALPESLRNEIDVQKLLATQVEYHGKLSDTIDGLVKLLPSHQRKAFEWMSEQLGRERGA